MTAPLHVVFCADRRVIPGLHVAAYSLLDRLDAGSAAPCFHLFSEDFTDADLALLETTLARTGKAYTLDRQRIDAARFAGFPLLNGSVATYYRLLVPEALEAGRFLYVDADTICDVDVSPLGDLDLGDAPAAWVPEAPLSRAIDRRVAEQLGNGADDFYFNAGVMLVDVAAWRSQQVTAQALAYLGTHPAEFWDQSALNYVLHGRAVRLDRRFNCIANQRPNWEALRRPYGEVGRLVHFLDYPKPWDFLGEFVHPQYALWRSVLDKTALSDFRTWQPTPARKWPLNAKAARNYKKVFKDRLLFEGYRRGWLRRVKGMNPI